MQIVNLYAAYENINGLAPAAQQRVTIWPSAANSGG